MIKNVRSTSLVAAVVGAFVLALTQPPVASAAAKANTNHVLTVSSGTIRVFVTSSQTFTSTGIPLTTIVGNGTVRTFFVNNSGNFGVSKFVMTITLPANSNVSAFRRCNINESFTGTNICSNGSSTNVTAPVTGVATTYNLTLPANSFYSFQIVQNKTGSIVVSTSVSLGDYSGGTTNS